MHSHSIHSHSTFKLSWHLFWRFLLPRRGVPRSGLSVALADLPVLTQMALEHRGLSDYAGIREAVECGESAGPFRIFQRPRVEDLTLLQTLYKPRYKTES